MVKIKNLGRDYVGGQTGSPRLLIIKAGEVGETTEENFERLKVTHARQFVRVDEQPRAGKKA